MISLLLLSPSAAQRDMLAQAFAGVAPMLPRAGFLALKETSSFPSFCVMGCEEQTVIVPDRARAVIRPSSSFTHPLMTDKSQLFELRTIGRLLSTTDLPRYTFLTCLFGFAMAQLLPTLEPRLFLGVHFSTTPDVAEQLRRALVEGAMFADRQGLVHDLFRPAAVKWTENDWQIPTDLPLTTSPAPRKPIAEVPQRLRQIAEPKTLTTSSTTVPIQQETDWLTDNEDGFDVFLHASSQKELPKNDETEPELQPKPRKLNID